MYRASFLKSFRTMLLMCLFLLPFDGWAQQKEIVITVYKKDDKGNKKPYSNVDVYGFNSSIKKKALMDAYNKTEGQQKHFLVDENMYDLRGVMNPAGFCQMLLPLTGFVVVIDREDSQVKEKPIKGRMNIDVTLDGISRQMKTVTVKEKGIIPPPPKIRACGNKLPIDYPIIIESSLTDSKSRMVITPLVSIVETGDTIGYLRPIVFDGVQFQEANERRMGFDETNDPLYYFRIPRFMETHKTDTVTIHDILVPIDRKLHYKVDGFRFFVSNSNTPYITDTMEISDGAREELMRFLDYSLVDKPIERVRYEERGKPARNEDHAKLDLNFLQGEARLDPSDTLNIRKLRDLRSNLSRYNGTTSSIDGVVIHGSASPEGGMAINERLCKERAEFIRQQLSSFPELREVRDIGGIKTTHKVATWADVAGLLEADSLKDEAASVRSILAVTSDMRKQEEGIRKLPCWDYINQTLLPRLRVADIQCDYITNRVKTKEEIWNEYQNDPDYHAGKKQQAYEFYHLFSMIENPEEKEVIAKAAYQSVSRYGKPWLLAAYELAQCYLARGYVDTTLLKPYIDITKNFDQQWRDEYGDLIKFYYNDKAVVTTQIKMFAQAGAYESALILSGYILDKIKKVDERIGRESEEQKEFERMDAFFKVLNCGYDDPSLEEEREIVSSSSYWNHLVMEAAQGNEGSWETALFMLNDSSKINQADPKVLYMKAQLRFNLNYSKNKMGKIHESIFRQQDDFEPSEDDPEVDTEGYRRTDVGLAMVQCCLLDSTYLDILRWDGVFSPSYRESFNAYWEKIKNGTEPKPQLPAPTAMNASAPSFDEDQTEEEDDPLMDVQ